MKRKVTTYDYACLNEARDILIRIDMPDNLVNPRSVMTLKSGAMPRKVITEHIML